MTYRIDENGDEIKRRKRHKAGAENLTPEPTFSRCPGCGVWRMSYVVNLLCEGCQALAGGEASPA